ncbi:MAG: FHA domain-containing protein, partial [Lachnospira sp.]
KKLKEMGELTQLTQEKKYSFVPEEEEEPKNNEKGQKPYEPPKEAAGSNTILLSDYQQKKKDLNLTLVLQNGQELESYYEERLLPDTFPCAIGNMAAYCSIVIHSELISRLHACIYREDGAFYLEDMNSTNGTFLNGRRLLPKERQLLSDGDMVGFANLLYKVEKS